METNDKKRSKKFRLRNVMKDLLARNSCADEQRVIYETIKRSSNLKKLVFALTIVTAFALGLSVGVFIRFLTMPKINIAIEDKGLTNGILVFNYTIEASGGKDSYIRHVIHFGDKIDAPEDSASRNLSLPFSRVSFVSDMTAVVHSSVYQRILSPSPTGSTTESLLRSNFTHSLERTVLNGIFWSEEIEKKLPQGYGDEDAEEWRNFLLTARAVKLDRGCGRMQNRLVTFHDGTRACVRYRQNTDQIQGELFSFYLGRILKVRNLAPSSLSVVRTSSPQWLGVKPQILVARWSEERPIILTKYIERLRSAGIPEPFRSNTRRLHPIDLKGSETEMTELVQWSDLVVFDYLTANLDRIVNNLYNLQWNPGMMEAPAHNLAKTTDDDLLLFLDNESGLLHGYRLLDKYEAYHSTLLESLCVFRKPTIDILKRLQLNTNVGKLLNENLRNFHYTEILPVLPEKSIKILNERINKVLDQVLWCERQYMDLTKRTS